MSALQQQQQQNSLMRKVKRTLPSPPPDEAPMPIVTPAMTHMYGSPGPMAGMHHQRVLPRPAGPGVITKAGLLHELKAVEQESSKLRKQQAELEEEEKEIDAKLRYLELGINQRKETRVKERERREAYMRSMGDLKDYMSESELNSLQLGSLTGLSSGYEGNGLLARPSTAPMSQYTSADHLAAASQYPATSSYGTYPYQQSPSSATQQPTVGYHQVGFQPPQYPTASQPQPGTFQPHPQPSTYQAPGSFASYGSTYTPDMSGHSGFQPAPGSSTSLPYPTQGMAFQPTGDLLGVHQRPRQTSLADLEQKLPTNYEVISNPTVSVAASAVQDVGFSGSYASTTMSSTAYGQYRPPEQTLSDRIPSPTSAYGTDSLGYTTNLEQSVPRNYVMIDDISELTKENMGPGVDSLGHPTTGRYGENGPSSRGSGYGGEYDDPYNRSKGTTGYHQQQGAVDSHGRPTTTSSSSYYYDDYNKHSSGGRGGVPSQRHSSKNLGPAVVSSKRSKHRSKGMEQKVSKFSPIEEARDVESDLASYPMTTTSGGSGTGRTKKLQEDSYGFKKSVYDDGTYYGSSQEGLVDDHMYGSGRSRSTGYGMDKISSRDSAGYRSKSYERDMMERTQRGTSRSGGGGRSSMRPQNSEEESPLSPVGKPMGVGRGTVGGVDPHDVRNQYGSTHSLPDVQDHHGKDVPRSHVYKPDDPYLVDDMHCAVSDSEGNWC